jgi:hypothetical protein
MEDILQNEVKRQEYMELRYKSYEEDSTKPDTNPVDDKDDDVSEKTGEDLHIKYMEETFNVDKLKILEELGLIVLNNDLNKDKVNEDEKK